MELADSIEEIGKGYVPFLQPQIDYESQARQWRCLYRWASVQLGTEEKYFPACYSCYIKQLESAQEKSGGTREGKSNAVNAEKEQRR